MSAQTTRQPVVASSSVRKSDHQGSRGRRSVRARSARSCGAKCDASGGGSRVRVRPALSCGTTMRVVLSGVCQGRT